MGSVQTDEDFKKVVFRDQLIQLFLNLDVFFYFLIVCTLIQPEINETVKINRIFLLKLVNRSRKLACVFFLDGVLDEKLISSFNAYS